MEGRDPGRVRLDAGDLLRRQPAHPGEAVRLPPPLQLVQARQVLGRVATTSLPQRWWAIPSSSQKR